MFNKLTITKKLTLLVTLVVVVTAGVLGYSVNNEYDKLLTQQELKSMGENTSEETARIHAILERMKEDVLFLSDTPPVQGIIRAQINNGIDRVDGSSENIWKKRLASIFVSFLKSKPHYLKVRYIGIKNKGKELVRVDKLKGKLKKYIGGNMQNKAHRAYFKKGITLKNNTVYLTDVNYDREFGEITKPYSSVMRAVTPVYNNEDNVFGMVVLTLDVTHMFSKFLSAFENHENEISRYIVNSNGDFLSTHEGHKILAFEFGESSSALLDHEGWEIGRAHV